MRILDRHLLRSVLGPFTYSFLALLSILLLQQIAKKFEALVGKGLGAGVIAEVFALSLPFLVPMALPIAVLAGTLYALTQLAGDNEITAMRASGVSVGRLLVPLLAAGVLWGTVNFLFIDQVTPRTNARLRGLLGDIARVRPTLELEEQRLNPMQAGVFLRAGRIDQGSGRLRDVTIYDLSGRDNRLVIFADSARMGWEPEGTNLTMRLFDGERHEYQNADPVSFQLTAFDVYETRIRDVASELERNTAGGIRGDREMSTCEMLDVAASQRREASQQGTYRRNLTRSDLRQLVGLAAVPPPMPSAETRSAGGYCALIRRLRDLLSPRTVEAQEPTQSGRRARADSARSRILLPRGPANPNRPERPVQVQAVGLTSGAVVAAAREAELRGRREAGQYLLEVHKKWTLGLACVTFVLLAVPLALRFPRGGMGLVLGGTGLVVGLFYIFLNAGESLADKAIVHPAIPMYAPNVLAATLGIIGLVMVNRESGTSRGGEGSGLLAPARRAWQRWRRRGPRIA